MVKALVANQAGQSHAAIEISESGHEQVDDDIVITGSSTMRKRLRSLARGSSLKRSDPSRPLNPDILQNIGDILADSGDWKTLVDLSRVSRYFHTTMKSPLRHLRKRVVLKLGHLDMKKTQGWSQVKIIECSRFSAYPINPSLAPEKKTEQIGLIQKQLQPSIIRFLGQPHESAFKLQLQLFPSVKVIRFIDDPLSSNLDRVFVPGVAEEKALALIDRKFTQNGLTARCTSCYSQYYEQGDGRLLKVVEYQKKGFERHNLDCMAPTKIQSAIQAHTSIGDHHFYLEDWDDYGSLGTMQIVPEYLRNHVKLPIRSDYKDITIDLFLIPDGSASGSLMYVHADHHPKGLDTIFDFVQRLATNHLDGVCCGSGTVKFRMFFIHGNTRPFTLTRPDYSRYENRPFQPHSDSESDEGDGVDDDDRGSDRSVTPARTFDSGDDDNLDHNNSQDNNRSSESEAHGPVMTLTFNKSGDTVRIREYDLDKDTLGCRMNGGCSRCRAPP